MLKILKRHFLTNSILRMAIFSFSKGINTRLSANVFKISFRLLFAGMAILDSSKGVNSWFRGKIEKSLFYSLFVEIKSKKMFHEVRDCKNCRKDAFLTSSILEVAILNFSKGVNPWFWVKIWKSRIARFCSESSRENFLAILKSAKNAKSTF